MAVAWAFSSGPGVVSPPRIDRPRPQAQALVVPDTATFLARFSTAFDPQPMVSDSAERFTQARKKLAEAMQAQLTPPPAAASTPKVPLPRTRPPATALMANLGAVSGAARGQQPFDALTDVSSALRKVFAMLQPSDIKLASASPDGGVSGNGQDSVPGLAGQQTAVYDIAAHVVYMPDGTRLEAHSGLGDLLDDPRQVHVHDRGATPPQVYELTPREKLFHGVQALRMKPVGEGDLFGRNGLLTHSYMMGPNGDSNGCVSFKDYDTFLKAYSNGEVKRLVVVPSLTDPVLVANAQKT